MEKLNILMCPDALQSTVQESVACNVCTEMKAMQKLSVKITQTLNSNNNSASKASTEGFQFGSLSPFAARTMIPNPKLSYMDRVIMEILETERMYVRDVHSIIEDYLSKMIDTPGLPIGPQQISALFGNIEDIYEFNSELLQELEKCDDDPVKVARCFVEKSPEFHIYTQYCTNYPNSVAVLTECMRNKVLSKFFSDRQASLKQSLPLGSYLLKPVQRVLKYHLLLQEIANHFNHERGGYDVVEEAIATMTEVAWYINDMKRKHEHAIRLQEVQSLLLNWKGPDLTTYGELMLEGTFRMQRARNERTLFLFDKMLLLTKRRGEHFIYKNHVLSSAVMLHENNRDCMSFSVADYRNPKHQYIIQVKNVEEKMLWTHHIKKLILENHHASIPQKAKEAILEMDSYYHIRYRNSPERLKKTVSYQTQDDTPSTDSQDERQPASTSVFKDTAGTHVEEVVLNMEEESGSNMHLTEILSNSESTNTTMPEPEAVEENLTTEDERYTLDMMTTSNPDCLQTEQTDEFKSLNNEEFSEDEEEEEMCTHETERLITSSIMDQAGAIVEKFITSISSRSSLALEDSESTGSPTLLLRSSNSSFLRSKNSEKVRCSTMSEGQSDSAAEEAPHFETANTQNGSESVPDAVFFDADNLENPEKTSKKESALSKQERLLINKIKNYYEHAEHENATFSIKRRESLSYIPSGLVRSSVFQFSNGPESSPEDGSSKQGSTSADSAGIVYPLSIGNTENTNTTWDSPSWISAKDADCPTCEFSPTFQNSHKANNPEETKNNTIETASAPKTLQTDEEFKCSSEMINIWSKMEQDMKGVLRDENHDSHTTQNGEYLCNSTYNKDSSTLFPINSHNSVDIPDSDKPLLNTEESNLHSLSEDSFMSSPERSSHSQSSTDVFVTHDEELSKTFRPTNKLSHHTVDRELFKDVPELKNKVLNLARQYSQRIKTNHPVVIKRLKHAEEDRELPSVEEEILGEEQIGKPKLNISLQNYNQVIIKEHSPVSPLPASSSRGEHVKLFPSSPTQVSTPSTVNASVQVQSMPTVSPVLKETFKWPVVRELCCKYTAVYNDYNSADTSNISSSKLVTFKKCYSLPEKVTPPYLMSAKSKATHFNNVTINKKGGSVATSEVSVLPQHNSDGRSQLEKDNERKLSRTTSLNKQFEKIENGATCDQTDQNNKSVCFVSSETTIQGDQKRVVVEKMPEKGKIQHNCLKYDCEDDSFVEIRSPTTREKICIKAVIERCKIYLESEEYHQKHSDGINKIVRSDEPGTLTTQQTSGSKIGASVLFEEGGANQQNLVRTLREKFQALAENT
ncbi:pleckstrin homology domain-containing family G member 3-like [Protopterus annectens]|uniref:pleckstrin homology domain-containing family G member 3-like n=1 Tax=Protopterus annectens TaxID=7888 RepID=UPI001CFA7B66|nr:pleckstrin homology domain-containing family G member 3-like [Protopterus annectens]XP_043929772.1 pleckstrin homology domain-containing family G member 3-like [Protopterus annectens]XP_043929773.1 pleckstrin homology domain-containing family G member 3-like [Protopterus annectens]XP_043929774.1 pleckstrin homology domain-containing family G member 3-like [Protopterus annectens]